MKVYITRDLKQDSPLLLQLQAAGYLVFGQSLIQIRALPVKELPHTDWLFFYSKNGVTALLDQLTDLSVLQAYQMAAFGSATAQLLQERGVDLDFVGNGKPDQVPAEFQKIVHTQTVCFIQGTSSRATVQKAIGAAIDFEECIVNFY